MDLEAVEQACLSYLKQVSNPLVPISRLMRHLSENEQTGAVPEAQLIEFLRDHELFEVFDPLGVTGGANRAAALTGAGFDLEARVVLTTRVPSAGELAEQLKGQIDLLMQALTAAAAEAQKSGDPDRSRQVIRLLDRAKEIRERLGS